MMNKIVITYFVILVLIVVSIIEATPITQTYYVNNAANNALDTSCGVDGTVEKACKSLLMAINAYHNAPTPPTASEVGLLLQIIMVAGAYPPQDNSQLLLSKYENITITTAAPNDIVSIDLGGEWFIRYIDTPQQQQQQQQLLQVTPIPSISITLLFLSINNGVYQPTSDTSPRGVLLGSNVTTSNVVVFINQCTLKGLSINGSSDVYALYDSYYNQSTSSVNVRLDGVTISSCNGGLLYGYGNYILSINHVLFYNNTASSSSSSLINMEQTSELNGGQLTLLQSLFQYNTNVTLVSSNYNYQQGSAVSINGVIFTSNINCGLIVTNGTTVSLINTLVSNNTISNGGALVSVGYSPLIMLNTEFNSNNINNNGGIVSLNGVIQSTSNRYLYNKVKDTPVSNLIQITNSTSINTFLKDQFLYNDHTGGAISLLNNTFGLAMNDSTVENLSPYAKGYFYCEGNKSLVQLSNIDIGQTITLIQAGGSQCTTKLYHVTYVTAPPGGKSPDDDGADHSPRDSKLVIAILFVVGAICVLIGVSKIIKSRRATPKASRERQAYFNFHREDNNNSGSNININNDGEIQMDDRSGIILH